MIKYRYEIQVKHPHIRSLLETLLIDPIDFVSWLANPVRKTLNSEDADIAYLFMYLDSKQKHINCYIENYILSSWMVDVDSFCMQELQYATNTFEDWCITTRFGAARIAFCINEDYQIELRGLNKSGKLLQLLYEEHILERELSFD